MKASIYCMTGKGKKLIFACPGLQARWDRRSVSGRSSAQGYGRKLWGSRWFDVTVLWSWKKCESGRQEGNSHLEGELGRTAWGDGTQCAPEVDGGREGTRRQQHRSLREKRKETGFNTTRAFLWTIKMTLLLLCRANQLYVSAQYTSCSVNLDERLEKRQEPRFHPERERWIMFIHHKCFIVMHQY